MQDTQSCCMPNLDVDFCIITRQISLCAQYVYLMYLAKKKGMLYAQNSSSIYATGNSYLGLHNVETEWEADVI